MSRMSWTSRVGSSRSTTHSTDSVVVDGGVSAPDSAALARKLGIGPPHVDRSHGVGTYSSAVLRALGRRRGRRRRPAAAHRDRKRIGCTEPRRRSTRRCGHLPRRRSRPAGQTAAVVRHCSATPIGPTHGRFCHGQQPSPTGRVRRWRAPGQLRSVGRALRTLRRGGHSSTLRSRQVVGSSDSFQTAAQTSASSVGTATTGRRLTRASPWIVASPTRSPVNDPGPQQTA